MGKTCGVMGGPPQKSIREGKVEKYKAQAAVEEEKKTNPLS